ncbi:MAG: carboxypeptidase-like regulatory domain-containing protein, partial [Parabacteroides gordonii]
MKKVLRPIGLILLSGALCSTGQVFATGATSEAVTNIAQQKKQVTGTVIDAFGPVAGASVSVKGTNEGTITDMDGNFSIAVAPGSTLSISFIGYVTQDIKYTGQATLDVKLMEDSQKIDEVVVTAMGIKKEKRALSYAMSELKSEDIQLVPVQNVANS